MAYPRHKRHNPRGGDGDGDQGSRQPGHTSLRLGDDYRDALRRLGFKRYGGMSMTAVIRLLVREACEREGVEMEWKQPIDPRYAP